MNARDELKRLYNEMIQRCDYPDFYYNRIKVCREWLEDINKFIEWSLENGFQPGFEIKMWEKREGYSPENCSWGKKRKIVNPTTDLIKGTRICSKCRRELPLSKFRIDTSRYGGHYYLCGSCEKIEQG